MECPACDYENIPGADVCKACGVSLTHEDLLAPAEDEHHSILTDPISVLNPPAPECVSSDTSVAEAVSRMQEKRVGCVLVTDNDGRLIGVFTERDVLYRVACQIRDLSCISVGSLMVPQPTALKLSAPIAYALHLMSIHGFRHIPLVDDGGKPIGITSFRGVVDFIGKLRSAHSS